MESIDQTTLDERLEYIKQKVQSVQGWTFDEAGKSLYKLANAYSPNGVVVELGSWKGRSTIWLGYGIKDRKAGGKVYAVDTWRGTPVEKEHEILLEGYT